MSITTTNSALACLDIYPNIDRIKYVKCPVMVLHGCLDQEVDVSHGQVLHDAVPERYQRPPWWVPDRGHNDLTDGPGRLAEYIRRLRTFLDHLAVVEEEEPPHGGDDDDHNNDNNDDHNNNNIHDGDKNDDGKDTTTTGQQRQQQQQQQR
jgi:hypothetical protein